MLKSYLWLDVMPDKLNAKDYHIEAFLNNN